MIYSGYIKIEMLIEIETDYLDEGSIIDEVFPDGYEGEIHNIDYSNLRKVD